MLVRVLHWCVNVQARRVVVESLRQVALSCEAGWEMDIRSTECKRKRPHKHHEQEALDY